jgi:hypothetical protein
MITFSRFIFGVLVVISVATLVRLYMQKHRNSAWWYLVLATWIALLIDGLFWTASLFLLSGQIVAELFLWFVTARTILSGWVLMRLMKDPT